MLDSGLVVVSPHLDDAVFSNWRLMTKHSRVTAISVCAGLPSSEAVPSRYDLLTGSHDPRGRMQSRRQEDLALASRIGWESRHLEFLDTPYRNEPHDLEQMARAIGQAMPDEFTEIAIPSAIGLHPDHVASRDAAFLAMERRGVVECLLYADLPYASNYGWAPWVTGAETDPYLDIDAFYAQALGQVRGWSVGGPVVTDLPAISQRDKLAAMKTYATQFPAMECGPSQGLSHPDRLRYEVHWNATRDS